MKKFRPLALLILLVLVCTALWNVRRIDKLRSANKHNSSLVQDNPLVATSAGPIANDRATSDQVTNTPVSYTGVESCQHCHQQQFSDWRGSDHDLAMQHADKKSVLGDFDQSQFQSHGVKTTFSNRDGKYFVNTDGPDGKLQDYQVVYTFGVYPLQQYLVPLPGGRLQALGVAWDSRPKDEGGQKWFHLYPGEKIDHKDELHWTRLSQNWNHMCAECHSTNLKKNFNLATKQFSTKWSELNVACEACHGPASQHLDWANKKPGWESRQRKGFSFLMDERRGVSWNFVDNARTAKRSVQKIADKEINTCARCHSRRSTISEDYHHGRPLLDTHLPSLLTENNYYPDGQIRDEVYVYGSFIQSKMYHSGVTCSDCHQPHTLKLRAIGNQLCGQCHQSSHYDSEKHHFHPSGSAGASCAECHMPPKNFMVIDGRHDHSIRIPRPDLSVKLNTPNACNNCHADKDAAWATGQMNIWYGEKWSANWHFGETLDAAVKGLPGAGQDLVAVALSPKLPDIARASAAAQMPNFPDRTTLVVLPNLLKDKSSIVRVAALDTVDILPPEQRWKLASSLLADPERAVRIEAARVLSLVPRETLSASDQQLLDKAVQEYISVQQTNAEHPQSHLNLGLLHLGLGQFENAERSYRQALELDSSYVSAYVNLADLYRMQQEDDKVEATLLDARKQLGEIPSVEHALGLHYVRIKQLPKALPLLESSAKLQPENVRFGYVYALALSESGQVRKAITVLTEIHDRHPNNADVLMALVTYNKELGNIKEATGFAENLALLNPNYGGVEQILQQ